jgi:peptide/nickel transport system permease protein
LGGGVRFYRTVVLEEVNSDYVRTARAKGVSRREILLTHVLRNVMIPVVTNTVITLPFLITGALLLERLFQIPGMGGLLVEAINASDRAVVMAIVYTTSVAYCLMLLVTDICYTLVDPRVSLK